MDNLDLEKTKKDDIIPIPHSDAYLNFILNWCAAKLPLEEIISEEQWMNETLKIEGVEEYKFIEPSPSELLKIFPDIIPIIKSNLTHLKEEYKDFEKQSNLFLDYIFERIHADQTQTPESREIKIKRAVRWYYDQPLNNIKKLIKKLESLIILDRLNKSTNKDKITQQDIEQAKQIALDNFIEVNRAGFIKCPFHNEKTPSCKFYKDQNRFHCFGCGADGDVIDFIMESQKVDFITAVKKLLNRK